MAIHKCPFCKRNYVVKEAVYDHMEVHHKDELHGLPAQQIFFNWRNRYALTKEFGKCVMTGKQTRFNVITGRYERFADESARQKYRDYFKKNMVRVYGKDTLLDEPEHQKKMLANRAISGVYKWSNGKESSTYTGTYEKAFLEYLDMQLRWDNGGDVMAPAPMTFPYKDATGKQRFHIPDFYITSLDLIVNIKSADNKHYRLRDLDDENAQDSAIKKSKFHYLKLYDKKFDKFEEIMELIEKQTKGNKKIILENNLG